MHKHTLQWSERIQKYQQDGFQILEHLFLTAAWSGSPTTPVHVDLVKWLCTQLYKVEAQMREYYSFFPLWITPVRGFQDSGIWLW